MGRGPIGYIHIPLSFLPQAFLEECEDVISRHNLAVQTSIPTLRQYAKTLVMNHEYLRDVLSAKSRRSATASANSTPRRPPGPAGPQ